MQKILVTYASRAGSTADIALVVAGQLRLDGFWVDCLPIDDVDSMKGYDGVVIGSAVRGRSWLPGAVRFIMMNYDALQRLPVAVFTVCMTLAEDSLEHREEVMNYLNPVRLVLRPQAEGYFAGRLEPQNLPPLTRLATRFMDKPEGDYRDWGAVQAWASSLELLFRREAQPATI